MKIYLAGKVGKQCWRHGIVDGLRDAWRPQEMDNWPVLKRAIFLQHDYVGPYFISCDHGCYHGPESHGAGAANQQDCYGVRDLLDPWGGHGGPVHEWVHTECRLAIRKADLFFAWIDRPDCYGTLVELGWASALGKRCAVCFADEGLERDMWFAKGVAAVVTESRWANPREALAGVLMSDHALPITEEPVRNPAGYVYLLTSGPHYKIGMAEIVDRRVTQIGIQMPYKTQLIHSIPTNNMRAAERHLHTAFAEHRLNGEWFDLKGWQVERIKRIPGLMVTE